MRHFYCATLVAAILVGGCSRQAGQQARDATSKGPADTPFEDLVIGQPVAHDNLAIFPIVSKTRKDADRFITLDEGLAEGTVKVIETGARADDPNAEPAVADSAAEATPSDREAPADQSPPQPGTNSQSPIEQRASVNNPFAAGSTGSSAPSGEVNRLLVLNTSGRPLYLMPGEVISGGLQDRTIGRELVIASGDKPVPIDVYCVERGRWSNRNVESTTQLLASLAAGDVGGAVAYPSADMVVPFPDADQADAINLNLTEAAARGEFVASAGQLNNAGRMAVQLSQDQSEVWDKVDQLHSALASEISTGAFASTWSNANVINQLKPFIEALESVGHTERIVGVAVCIDGTMRLADVFESTPLFRKYWPKLLSSYALDAIAAAAEKEDDAPATKPCTLERCIAFLKESAQAEQTGGSSADEGVARRESPRTISFSYYDRRANPGHATANPATTNSAGGQMGGFGGAVHSGVFAK